MKRNKARAIWTAVLFTVLSVNVWGQVAEDFNVTDITGETHTLYSDYLDEGHVMVLGMFYIGAPMLEDLFPALQGYAMEEWAAEEPVDFLLMSNYDSNAELQSFAFDHSITLPIVGNEGGAGAAMAPYINGTYGDFFGYPLFVVIGPEGQVIFDPWGDDLESILSSLNAAIESFENNPTSVIAQAEVSPKVYASQNAVHVELPNSWSLTQMRLYGVDGRLLKETALERQATRVPLDASGPFIYTLDAPGRTFSGKFFK